MSIYSCATQTCLNKLIVKQKEAVRIICNAGYRDHTAPLFTQLRILPIDKLIKYNALKFMHSFARNLLPISFARMWTTNSERFPDRDLRNANQLFIPAHNFKKSSTLIVIIFYTPVFARV